MEQLDEQLEEIRTICRLHAVPTASPRDLSNLPLRLSQDAGFRSDITEIVRSFQAANSHLPDVLNTFILAIGGKLSPAQTRDIGESIDLLCGFLLSVGRWPDTNDEPVLAPGEVPSNLPDFIRPPSSSRNGSSRPDPATGNGNHHPVASPQPSPQPSPQTARELPPAPPEPAPSDPPSFAAADIVGALARLERGSFELRAHLESIDQRISRIEPLLELGAPPPASRSEHPPTSAPPALHNSRQAPQAWGAFPREDLLHVPELHADELHTPALHAETLEAPTDPAVTPSAAPTFDTGYSNGANGSTRPETSVASPPTESRNFTRRPSTAPTVPRFSRFTLTEELPEASPIAPAPIAQTPIASTPIAQTPIASAPIVPPPAPIAAAPAPTVSAPIASATSSRREAVTPARPDANLQPIALPHGFFGTAPNADSVAPGDLTTSPRPRQKRRSLLVAVASILLLVLAAAGVLFYLRFSSPGDDPTPHSSGITSLPAPRAPAQNELAGPIAAKGPLTATPAKPSAASPDARVLGARRAFEPRQSAEDLQTVNGFRPAGTFVPASIMEGRLLSAPLSPHLRVSPDAGLKGLVILEANISTTGQVEDLNVLGGSKSLRSAAIDTVRNWKYKPFLRNGVPVEVRTIVRVDFNDHKPQPADTADPLQQ